MKNNTLFISIGVLGVLSLLYYSVTKNNAKNIPSGDVIIKGEVDGRGGEVSAKSSYSPALLREYELIVPPFKSTLKAQIQAAQINAKRYAIDERKVKPPLFL